MTFSSLTLKLPKLIRYGVSGAVATGIDLGLLFVFKSIFHIWYLLSVVLAFVIAFGVSFSLQKFWTFQDRDLDVVKSQIGAYSLIAFWNLGLNTLLMYICVDMFGLHYIFSQFIVSGLVAVQSYFLYARYVFKKTAQRSI